MDIRQHLIGRHLDPMNYAVSWDDETACFLLFDLSGRVVGYQQYRPGAPKTMRNDPREGRYYTYFTGRKDEKQFSVWGLETWDYSAHVLFVTEGIFDAVRLHQFGYSAVAVLSNDPKFLRNWLFLIRQQRKVIVVCDDDAAGRKLAKFGDVALFPHGSKDLGDMTHEEVAELVLDAVVRHGRL